jgi:hypothetical protein
MTLWGKSDLAPQSGPLSYESMLRLDGPTQGSCTFRQPVRPAGAWVCSPVARVGHAGTLREPIGFPTELVQRKVADRLHDLTRQLVERSPFVCVTTASPAGGLDVSPRGDPAGFVRIIDERTLLMPERPGNTLADMLTNLRPSARRAGDDHGRPELCAADGADPCAPGAARRLHGDVVARPVSGERTAERRLG